MANHWLAASRQQVVLQGGEEPAHQWSLYHITLGNKVVGYVWHGSTTIWFNQAIHFKTCD